MLQYGCSKAVKVVKNYLGNFPQKRINTCVFLSPKGARFSRRSPSDFTNSPAVARSCSVAHILDVS